MNYFVMMFVAFSFDHHIGITENLNEQQTVSTNERTKRIKVTRFVPSCSGHDFKRWPGLIKTQFTPGMVFVF